MKARAGLVAVLLGALGLGAFLWWRAGESQRQPTPAARASARQRLPSTSRGATVVGPNVSGARAVTAQGARPFGCEDPQRVAETVNGRKITLGRLCERMKLLTGGTAPNMALEVLSRLEEEELVAGALEERRIRVTEAEVEAELSKLAGATGGAEQGLTAEVLRTEAVARANKRKLVDALGRVEPTSAELKIELLRLEREANRRKVDVEGWIARVGANAPSEAVHAAERDALKLATALRRGERPGTTALTRLPSFELAEGDGEPELEELLLRQPSGGAWQLPVRTRAGWVVARATPSKHTAPGQAPTEEDARRGAAEQKRKAEERRILDELRERAAIVLHVTVDE